MHLLANVNRPVAWNYSGHHAVIWYCIKCHCQC